ncbi:MAG: DNA polymerase II [Theionarchaea archaeon]|nr:DNA polymerase II [Theionarchaea archaeon]
MKGLIIHPTYRTGNGKSFVHLYGCLENGESFLTISEFRPYFYIKKENLKAALDLEQLEFKEVDMKTFSGNEVVKIFTQYPQDVGNLKRKLYDKDIECYEADIRFAYRFLIDKGLRGFINIEGMYKKGERVDRVYENPDITPEEPFDISLKIVSLDIEVNEPTGEIVCLTLYDKKDYFTLLLKKEDSRAKTCTSEMELLSKFKEEVLKRDPDIITGWNVVDFDLAYLYERFKKYRIAFDLGRSEAQTKFRTETSFIRASRVKIDGRMVLDAMHLLRDFFIKLDDYKLGTAGMAILGEGKIDIEKDIERVWNEHPSLLVEYNQKDTQLVTDIIEKKKLIELSKRMTGITGLQLDRVKAAIASLDSLYLRESQKRGVVCPSVSGRSMSRVTGGLVQEPTYGVYDYVLLFDFRSLYPSIMATFNIDPVTYTEEETVIRAPNNVYFREEPGILPEIILNLLERRQKADIYEEQYAIKIIMNSLFGVFGNPLCRFYNSKIANAITFFGRYFLEETTRKVESMGYEVIYGDTDSLFVVSGAASVEEAHIMGDSIEKVINDFYDTYVQENYSRKNYLQLEFERVYEKFLLPRQRHLKKGAKKRYAGFHEGEIDIVGLEYVRRDWTELAREFQYNLLEKVFSGENIDGYIRDTVENLKSGKLDDLLVYKKGVRKDLAKYTKTTPPHVKAARKMDDFSDRVISYVMTKRGPEPVDGTPKRIDYDHYIEKQLKPIANSILHFYDKSFSDVVTKQKQMSLEHFL